MPTPDQIDDLFTYHAPTPDQIPHYEAIRAAAKEFAKTLMAHTPQSPDQSTAIRHLRDCVYCANASVALRGQF